MARILVVDEEESIRFTFEMFLEDEGHDVVAVARLAEALRALAVSPFDLIYADVILRDGSGFDVVEEVRRLKLRCPVILTSGCAHLEALLMAIRLGTFDFFQKPVRQQVLLEVTERALELAKDSPGRDRSCSNLKAILRDAQDSILLVDRDMMVIEISEAAVKRCGLGRDIIGRRLKPPCEDCGTGCLDLIRMTLQMGVAAGPEWLFCGPDSLGQKPVSAMTYPFLDSNGRFAGAVLTVRGADEVRGVNRVFEHEEVSH